MVFDILQYNMWVTKFNDGLRVKASVAREIEYFFTENDGSCPGKVEEPECTYPLYLKLIDRVYTIANQNIKDTSKKVPKIEIKKIIERFIMEEDYHNVPRPPAGGKRKSRKRTRRRRRRKKYSKKSNRKLKKKSRKRKRKKRTRRRRRRRKR